MPTHAMYDWPSTLRDRLNAIERQVRTIHNTLIVRLRYGKEGANDKALREAADEMRRRVNDSLALVTLLDKHIGNAGYRMEDRANGDLDNPLWVILDKRDRVIAYCLDQNDAERILTALLCAPSQIVGDKHEVFNAFFQEYAREQKQMFNAQDVTLRVPYGWAVDPNRTDSNAVTFTITDKEFCQDVLEGRV